RRVRGRDRALYGEGVSRSPLSLFFSLSLSSPSPVPPRRGRLFSGEGGARSAQLEPEHHAARGPDEERAAVGREGHARALAGDVEVDPVDLAAALELPEADGRVGAARRGELAVGGAGEGEDGALVALERAPARGQRVAGVLDEGDRLALAGPEEALAVGGE